MSARERLVDYAEYREAVRRSGAALVFENRGGIGETERWETPDGRVVARLVVRYFRGEHDYDYYICG